MTLRGKDYCNCDHARMLRQAINNALQHMGAYEDMEGPESLYSAIEIAHAYLASAIREDSHSRAEHVAG